MASSYIYSILLVAFAASSSVSALSCYSCNSQDSIACRWGLTSFTYNTETCASVGSVLDSFVGPKCYKVTARNKDGAEMIARGCLPPPGFGCEIAAKAAGWLSDHSSNDPNSLSDLSCVTCDGDNCNSASKLAGFTIFGVLIAIFAFLF